MIEKKINQLETFCFCLFSQKEQTSDSKREKLPKVGKVIGKAVGCSKWIYVSCPSI